MSVEVRVTVAAADLPPTSQNATLRIERAASPTGFVDGTSQIASGVLVPGQTSYTYVDPTGTSASWYRTRFATAVPVYSAYSSVFQGILPPLVSLPTLLTALGVASDSPKVPLVQILLDAVSAEIRRLTGRELDGAVTTRDEIHRVGGRDYLWLRHVPVISVTSISRSAFDGTIDDPYTTDRWRLENPTTGLIRLATRPPYARVIYVGSGLVTAQYVMAAIEWCKARWEDFTRDHALASYSTGSDSESYNTAVAGRPPIGVAGQLATLAHIAGHGGPI
jgi:hypothetical protein